MVAIELIPTGNQLYNMPGYALSIDSITEKEEYYYYAKEDEYHTENPSVNLLQKLLPLPCHHLPEKLDIWTNWHFEANPFMADTIVISRKGNKLTFRFELFLSEEQHQKIKWNYAMLIDHLVQCALKNGLEKDKYYEKPVFPEEYYGCIIYQTDIDGTFEQKINEAKKLLKKSVAEAEQAMQNMP